MSECFTPTDRGSEMLPNYPIWALTLPDEGSENEELITRFISVRSDDAWLLAGQPAVSGERQLWVAWIALTRRFLSGKMRSTGKDGEFLRLLAGTHHVSQGFRRAGISEGDTQAWLVHIPSSDSADEFPVLEYESLEETARELIAGIGASPSTAKPAPTTEGLHRLGIFDEAQIESLQNEPLQEYFIGHINSADLFN